MLAARSALWVPLVVTLAVACDQKRSPTEPPAANAGGEAGRASGGTSAEVDGGNGGDTIDLPEPGGAAGEPNAAPLGELTLSVWSVFEREPVVGHDPTSGELERVELPPWFTLVANVPPATTSVVFTLDGEQRVDDGPPFLLHEDAFARARWQPTVGQHVVEARAFAEAGGAGRLLAELSQTIDYRETGLQPDFTPLSAAENEAWVEDHLASVMQTFELQGSLGDTLPYRLFIPPDYDSAVKYPLVVFLHDRAGRGADNDLRTCDSALFRGARSLVSPNLRQEFPAIVLVPQCPAEPAHHEWARWYGATEGEPQAGLVFEDGYYPSHDEPSRAAELVRELVEDTLSGLSVDPERVYLAGESMGGTGTWDIAWRWPEVWAAAVPIAGYTDPSRAPELLDLPFWVFHSTLDTQENVIGSLNMVDKLKVLCGSVRYTQYTDATHAETLSRVWNTEELLFPWIWSQRRTP